MITPKDMRKLKPGAEFQWRDKRTGALEPGTGVLYTDADGQSFIRWPDGQETWSGDDWALECVELLSRRTA